MFIPINNSNSHRFIHFLKVLRGMIADGTEMAEKPRNGRGILRRDISPDKTMSMGGLRLQAKKRDADRDRRQSFRRAGGRARQPRIERTDERRRRCDRLPARCESPGLS
jgi:hypothetical protein